MLLCSFEVTNGESSRSGILHLTIHHADRVPPTLQRNSGLRLQGGASEPITSQQLQLSDPDTAPSNLTFRLTVAPRHGQLLLGGAPLAPPFSFTQDHLDQQQLVYQHQPGALETSDSFAFLPSDGTNAGYLHLGQLRKEPQVFHIQVSPHLEEPLLGEQSAASADPSTIKDQVKLFSSHSLRSGGESEDLVEVQMIMWNSGANVEVWRKSGRSGGSSWTPGGSCVYLPLCLSATLSFTLITRQVSLFWAEAVN